MEPYEFFDDLILRYDHFIFDCDGVLVFHGGEIGKSFKVLTYIQTVLKKKVYILSNYGGGDRKAFADYFATFGFIMDPAYIYSSAYLTAKYVRAKYPDVHTVYYLGNECQKSALESLGFKTIGEEDDVKTLGDYNVLIAETKARNIGAVVVSYDPHMNGYKIYTSCVAIGYGAKLIVTNRDPSYQSKSKFMPDTGAIVSSIEISTGKQAELAGKPSPFAFETILEEHGITDKHRVLMIGDTIGTDIIGAANAKIDSCYICEKGIALDETLKNSPVRPTYIVQSISHWKNLSALHS